MTGSTETMRPVSARRDRIRPRLRLPQLPRGTQLWLGASIVGVFLLLALFAPWVTPHDPILQYRGQELSPPSAQFWFGTDQLGRDIFSRVIFGTRASIQIGLIAVCIGAGIGAVAGISAGYFQGIGGAAIMRFAEALFAMPALVLGIAFAAVFGASSEIAAIAIGIAAIPAFARISRAATLTVRTRDYILSARMSGANHVQAIVRHVVPNILGPILVQLAVSTAAAVLISAGLSFIGLGTQPPTPSWGEMLKESLKFSAQAPWYGIFPGVALTIMVLGLNTLADGLHERLDAT